MRWLALLSWAVFALFGCSSTPLDAPIDEPIAQDGTTGPSAPLGASEGDFRKIAPYPAGPYGSELGAIIADQGFLGWRDPPGAGFDSTRLEQLMFSDYHDPDGGQTELIVLNASAVWCPACRLEMETIDALDHADRYRASKVALFGTLFEDVTGAPRSPRISRFGQAGSGSSSTSPSDSTRGSSSARISRRPRLR